MEQLKQAVITEDGKIRCPYCGKTCGMVTGTEYVRNYKIRCRGSRREAEHFFLLNVGEKEAV